MQNGTKVAGVFPSGLLFYGKGGECYMKRHNDLIAKITKLLWALAALTTAIAELVRVIKM